MADDALRILQRNEKIKLWSTQAANLGSALVAAGAGRIWLVGFDPWVAIWSVLGFFMILSGTRLLDGLQTENQNG